jgi:site-specific recombinase XerD
VPWRGARGGYGPGGVGEAAGRECRAFAAHPASLRVCPRTILSVFQWAADRAISRESVQGYVTWLGEMKISPSTINQRLAAIRKLATEAQRCGYVDSETAQAIVSVAGVKQKGRRLGRWLAWEEARTLLQAPNPHSIRGMRDRALLAVLVTCALCRGELSRMNCEHLAMHDGRWVFLDFLGKGNKTRSVGA